MDPRRPKPSKFVTVLMWSTFVIIILAGLFTVFG